MTKKQYDELKIGDLVTKTLGPNKNIIMKVIKKYLGYNDLPCISASAVNDEQYIYNQNRANRDGKHTCGSASCFKLVKENKNERK